MALSVSVLIPCFRCADTIGRAVASALAQSEPPLEVILADDASPDDTPAVLAELARKDPRVRVIRLPKNGGASVARNAAWEAARGEFVALLDADDRWHRDKLAIQTAFMRAHPQFPMTAHRYGFAEPAPFTLPPEPPYTEVHFRSMLYRNWFHTSSVMMRRDLPQRFDTTKRYGEDRQLWLDVAASGRPIARIDLDLVTIYKPLYGTSGLSGDLWAMEAAELATFRGLHAAGKVSAPMALAICGWSLARYLKRLLVVALRPR